MLFEKQQYQQDCVDHIIRVLDGVFFANTDFNQLDIRDADFSAIKDNLRRLADAHSECRRYPMYSDQARLDVLMETGTGKTFTYLQTIFELNRHYEQRKFLIVLPRTAIKQGVMQNIRLTGSYFFSLYKKHIKSIGYPECGLGAVEQDFIKSDDLCVLITTNSAFNSAANNINKRSETLYGMGSAWEGIARRKPVIIIDEPHLLQGEQTTRGLDKLKQSLFIRFGATFPAEEKRRLSNVVYALNSIDAFNRHLVKRIGVSTVYADGDEGGLAITNICGQGERKRFDLCFSRNGLPQRAILRKGDDIGAKSGLSAYHGKVVTRINARHISLSDKRTIAVKVDYHLSEQEIAFLLREAIERHFAKEQALYEKDIKALTLVFIPQINDYRGENPRIKNIFERVYREVRQKFYQETKNAAYRAYLDRDFDRDGQLCVHQGYFSGDKGSKNEKERRGVDMILNDKEKLLSFKTPLRFVFSVWALQEGWDNPNIFTICKLAASDKDTSRRQQVGRGLRLAVNQSGKRITLNHENGDDRSFYDINTLDMVVAGKEQTFIHEIQNEINEVRDVRVGDALTLQLLLDKGLSDEEAVTIYSALSAHGVIIDGRIRSPIFNLLRNNRNLFPAIGDERFEEILLLFAVPPRPIVTDNNRQAVAVKIRENNWAVFKELWETINRKAEIVYKDIREETLIDKISSDFNNETIPEQAPRSERRLQKTNVQNAAFDEIDERIWTYQAAAFDINEVMLGFARENMLPLDFLRRLFAKLKKRQFDINLPAAQKVLRELIREAIHGCIFQHIDYKFVETSIYPNALQYEDGSQRGELKSEKLGSMIHPDEPPPHFLYDKAVYDSDIERECIINDPQETNHNKITVFAKLPQINIPTPYKNYNPDFAYLVETADGRRLFLVVETKGYDKKSDIPPEERQKIDYGRKFFEKLDKQLPAIQVVYKTRLNKTTLGELVNSIIQS